MITTNINKAKKALINDEIVAIPKETVYGLAENAYSKTALKKIFLLKNRPSYNPLIVHIKSAEYLNNLAQDIPEMAIKLAKEFWPGPLTLVVKKQKHIPDLVTAEQDTVAIRIPNHPVELALLTKLEFPLAAPSANPFGSFSPTSAEHVLNYFGSQLKIILNGGECSNGLESTIIGFENNHPVFYRHGSISIEEIELCVGKVIIKINNGNKPIAPGMFSRHYAPSTDTYLTNNVVDLLKTFRGKNIGLLLYNTQISHKKIIIQEVLSKTGDLKEAAKNLYAVLHRLDKCNLDNIIAEKLSCEGLGKTINDRLERAIKK